LGEQEKVRYPHAVTVAGALVLRFDSNLFFANVVWFKERLGTRVVAALAPSTGLIPHNS
jgi:hypothetical protein